MDLIYLPEELLETIAEYLSMEDIIACSSVNTQWRTTFNTNRIWKRFCTFHPCYFDKQKSKFNYKIGDDVNNACDEKIRALQEKFVVENITNGIYIAEEIDLGTLFCDKIVDYVDNVGNHWLFVACSRGGWFEIEHMIKIWNLNDVPVLHSTTTIQFGPTCTFWSNIKMEIKNGTLYFTDDNTLLIYTFYDPLYELECVTYTTLKSTVYEALPCFSTEDIVFKDNMVINFFYSNQHATQKLPPSYIGWNNDTLLQFKDDKLHLDNNCNLDNSVAISVQDAYSDKVLVAFQCLEQTDTVARVAIFNVELLQYTHFIFEKKIYENCLHHDICDNVISLLYLEKNELLTASCYNILNSAEIFKKCIEIGREQPTHQLLSGEELVVLANRTFHLYNILQNKEINTFNIEGNDFGTLFVLSKSLVLLECLIKGVTQDIWNIRTGQKMYTLNLSSTLGLDQYWFDHRFIKDFACPPKIMLYKDPLIINPHWNVKKNKIFLVSFW